MKITTKMAAGAIAVAVFATTSVQALPIISGNITFAGGATGSESDGVTTFTPANPWWDLGGSGAYLNTGGAEATFNAVSYTGTGASATLTAPVDPLWTFTLSGITYSFDLTSLISADVGANFVSMTGTGVANITGYQTTDATWSLAGIGANQTFVINFGTTSSTGNGGSGGGSTVPDGGMTVVMLGLALGACGLFARRFQSMMPRPSRQKAKA